MDHQCQSVIVVLYWFFVCPARALTAIDAFIELVLLTKDLLLRTRTQYFRLRCWSMKHISLCYPTSPNLSVGKIHPLSLAAQDQQINRSPGPPINPPRTSKGTSNWMGGWIRRWCSDDGPDTFQEYWHEWRRTLSSARIFIHKGPAGKGTKMLFEWP